MQLPSKPEYINDLEFIRILAPYIFVQGFVKDKSVLDIGSGFGHGAGLMDANGATRVITFDLDKIKIKKFHGFYSNAENINPFVMDAQRIGLKENSVQVITCFEVIEHVSDPDLLLSEIKRVLRAEGILFLTTPNKKIRLLPLQRPWNPEHLREYSLRTLQNILRKHFPIFEVLGIYGNSLVHKHYKKKWKQNGFFNYFGFVISILGKLVPKSIKQGIRHWLRNDNSNGSSHDPIELNKVDPVSDQRSLPFYLSDADKNCLNIFVICGSDKQAVQRITNEITKITRFNWKYANKRI
jgi:SAM-dependent methyltransferase